MTVDPVVAFQGPILVIGTGLIGTSIALALRRAGIEVYLEDTDEESLTVAVERGAGLPVDETVEPSLVIAAIPPRYAADVLARASAQYPLATLTDVTSVKARILEDAHGRGADRTRLIGATQWLAGKLQVLGGRELICLMIGSGC